MIREGFWHNKRKETEEGEDVSFTEVTVPGNADTLHAAQDKAAWWRRFRPLVVQTPCLGPIDANHRREGKQNPVFQGIRTITIKNNVIQEIALVTLAEIKRSFGGPGQQDPKDDDGQVAKPDVGGVVNS